MNILVTGFNGFLGQEVKLFFESAGHTVQGIPRQVLMNGGVLLDEMVALADVVINLAGASLFHRWTDDYKQVILSSRQLGTRNIVDAINRTTGDKEPGTGVRLLINASATGIYPAGAYCDEGTEETGSDFLADVVRAWEKEAVRVRDVRVVILRFGVIAGSGGGVVRTLMPLIRLHLGVVVGDGQQPFPVIHVDDVTGFMLYAVNQGNIEGIYNMVTPEETDYNGFVKALSRICRSWITFSIPEGVLKLVVGSLSAILTQTAHVVPRRLLESGYQLKCRNVEEVTDRVAGSL